MRRMTSGIIWHYLPEVAATVVAPLPLVNPIPQASSQETGLCTDLLGNAVNSCKFFAVIQAFVQHLSPCFQSLTIVSSNIP